MSKKINPKSLRLGFTQLWLNVIQNYGNTFSIMIKLFYHYLKIINIFTSFFVNNKIIFSAKEILFYNSTLVINLWIWKINYFDYFDYLKKLSKLVLYWNLTKNIYIRFYLPNPKKFCYSFILLDYVYYLITILSYSPKKVLGILSTILYQKLLCLNIIYSKNGPVKIKLKGFKFTLNGCFEHTKLQMSETLELKSGSLTLNTLKNKVDFSSKIIYTKLGSLNFKIWLFFEILP